MNVELQGTESGLVAYYQLNEATGQTAEDHTSFGNNGELGNTARPDGQDPIKASAEDHAA